MVYQNRIKHFYQFNIVFAHFHRKIWLFGSWCNTIKNHWITPNFQSGESGSAWYCSVDIRLPHLVSPSTLTDPWLSSVPQANRGTKSAHGLFIRETNSGHYHLPLPGFHGMGSMSQTLPWLQHYALLPVLSCSASASPEIQAEPGVYSGILSRKTI